MTVYFFQWVTLGHLKKFFSHPGLTLLDSAKIQIITVIFLLFLLILIQKFFVNKKLNNIRKGECYFSRVLYKSARSIDILYSKEKVINDLISFFESSGAIQYYPFFYLLCDVYFYPIKKTFINNRKISIEMIRLVFIDFLRKILESSSNPHSFGIPLVMICHAPFLKRDLYYREMVDLAQLALMFDILQYPFKEQTLFEYRRRGSLSNQTLFRQVMIQIGVL